MKKFWQITGIVLLTAAVSVGTTDYMTYRQQKDNHQLISYSTGESSNMAFAAQHRTESVTSVAPVDFTQAAEMSVGAVVHVKTKYNVYGKQYVDPFYQFFFGRPQQQPMQQAQATGSGVILSEDGYIVTNNHVIQQANEIEVVLNDKRAFTAELIGTD